MYLLTGSFSNDDWEGNENCQKKKKKQRNKENRNCGNKNFYAQACITLLCTCIFCRYCTTMTCARKCLLSFKALRKYANISLLERGETGKSEKKFVKAATSLFE